MRIRSVSALLLGMLLGSACSPVTTDRSANDPITAIPRTTPSMVGQVTAVTLPTIVVEQNPAEPHGSPKARVRLAEGARVLRQNGAIVDPAALRMGQRVRIWFIGPVMESYPLQATADVIVIESDND